MNITADTKAIAQKAYDYLIMNPEKHNQNHWVRVDDDYQGPYDDAAVNACGTTMCVAGTVQWQQEGRIRLLSVEEVAAAALGLNDDEGYSLFHTYDNDEALNALNAIAQGDRAKFESILY